MTINRIIYRDKPKADIFRSLVQTFWKDNPDCEVATISITKDKPKRSDAQNRLFHTWRDVIAIEMGESKEETKNLIKNKFSIKNREKMLICPAPFIFQSLTSSWKLQSYHFISSV